MFFLQKKNRLEGLERLSRYYAVSQGILGMPKSIFKTHVTIAIFLYYTFNIHHYSVEGQDLRVQLDASR